MLPLYHSVNLRVSRTTQNDVWIFTKFVEGVHFGNLNKSVLGNGPYHITSSYRWYRSKIPIFESEGTVFSFSDCSKVN